MFLEHQAESPVVWNTFAYGPVSKGCSCETSCNVRTMTCQHWSRLLSWASNGACNMYIVVDSLVIQLTGLRTNLQGSEYSLTIDEMLSMMFHVQSIAQYFSFNF